MIRRTKGHLIALRCTTEKGDVMGYAICKLQNSHGDGAPDIAITEDDAEWESALARWKDMKNPTYSPLWKKGVFALTRLVLSAKTIANIAVETYAKTNLRRVCFSYIIQTTENFQACRDALDICRGSCHIVCIEE